ncbi:hypothetical protein M4R22_08015 [Acidovorax sp. GBBC 3334]|uniref:hypothetical protein n=1 Tax=Acidovorax sp. GBBC 3334 TaxID=2940496 RepID=UPI00230459D5|nr:hypothetical protein [Acidovorax sp. GBBC 3334]MDA8454705.1 hypothetical protein [Acidovorax sp. GBBC 3334]
MTASIVSDFYCFGFSRREADFEFIFTSWLQILSFVVISLHRGRLLSCGHSIKAFGFIESSRASTAWWRKIGWLVWLRQFLCRHHCPPKAIAQRAGIDFRSVLMSMPPD